MLKNPSHPSERQRTVHHLVQLARSFRHINRNISDAYLHAARVVLWEAGLIEIRAARHRKP